MSRDIPRRIAFPLFPSVGACLVVVILAVAAPLVHAQGTGVPPIAPRNEPQLPPGINDPFLDPKLNVQEWLGRFEVESREIYASRERILAALQLQKGQRVADVGAGTGFFSRMIANKVGDNGWVYAVEISSAFLKHIADRARQDGIKTITPVLCAPESISLPPDSIDLAFVCDTYHHLEYPRATLASIHQALRLGGTLVVIDFERIAGKSRPWVLDHVRAGKETFRAEIESAGFELVEEVKIETLRENYFLRFRKK